MGGEHYTHHGHEGHAMEQADSGNNPLERLRESERVNISFARAFIVNPEVLIMDNPFSSYHSRDRRHLLADALLEHRDNRGYIMPIEDKHLRRPRTIFYSIETDEDVGHIA